MWIKFKESYCGPLGMFPKDGEMDLPESTVKKLTEAKAAFEEVPAPWDRKKDLAAAKKAELVGKAKDAVKWLNELIARHKACIDTIRKLVEEKKSILKELPDAEKKARSACKAAGIEFKKVDVESEG